MHREQLEGVTVGPQKATERRAMVRPSAVTYFRGVMGVAMKEIFVFMNYSQCHAA